MADTQVRQVVPGRWGGEAVATEYVRSSRLFLTRWSLVGQLKKVVGDVLGGVVCGVGSGEAGDIATEPRTIDAIAALPAGLSVSGRVGEGEWCGSGPCPGGY